MDKSYRISLIMPKNVMEKLEKCIDLVTDAENQDKAFILQIDYEGYATGLALCPEHAKAVRKITKPIALGAEDLREI